MRVCARLLLCTLLAIGLSGATLFKSAHADAGDEGVLSYLVGPNGEITSQRPDQPPKTISASKPRYPSFESNVCQKGLVVLLLRISIEGKVLDSQIAQTSNYPLLDQAAKPVSMSWLFKPAVLNGEPVEVWMAFRVKFLLEDAPPVCKVYWRSRGETE